MTCERCGRTLTEYAYEQQLETIKIQGTRATWETQTVLVCEDCA